MEETKPESYGLRVILGGLASRKPHHRKQQRVGLWGFRAKVREFKVLGRACL